jgi:hypothetical protein
MRDFKNPYVNQKIMATVQNLKSNKEEFKKKSSSRMVYDSINDFYFDDEKGIYLEKDGHHSYTFEIIRNYNLGKLENLIFNSKDNGEYDVIYVKYDYSKADFQSLSLDEFRNSTTKYHPMDAEGRIGITQWICFETFEYQYVSEQPQGGIPTQSPLFSWQWVSTGTTCDMLIQGTAGSGGDGNAPIAGSGSNSSNTGPNGGGIGGTSPPIITVPSGCVLCPGQNETIPKTPCESLGKILQTPTSLPAGAISIKDALTQLSNNADDGLDHEEGFNFAFNPTTGQVYAVPADPQGSNVIKYSKNPLVFGGAHFHQFGLEPQFSHDDLYVLNMFNTQFSNLSIISSLQAPLPMHLLVTTDGDVYAIMAEDMQAFSTLINDIYLDENKRDAFRKKLERRYAKFFRASTNSYTGDTKDYQETLLKFINNVNPIAGNENGNLSLKLYKATKVNDVLTGEWKELKLQQTNELNFNNFTIEKINCN